VYITTSELELLEKVSVATQSYRSSPCVPFCGWRSTVWCTVSQSWIRIHPTPACIPF